MRIEMLGSAALNLRSGDRIEPGAGVVDATFDPDELAFLVRVGAVRVVECVSPGASENERPVVEESAAPDATVRRKRREKE